MRSNIVTTFRLNLFSKAVIVAVVGITFLGTAHAQIITNGGFESSTPLAPAGTFNTVAAGSTALTGWTVESGSVDVINSGFWQAYSGSQSIDLDGSAAGTISQVFSTIVGNRYNLTFAYANNYSTAATVGALVTAVDSSATPKTIFSSSISHSGSAAFAMNYTVFNGSFIADTTQTTLRFASTDGAGANQGIALDGIAVSNVGAPEPTALCLALLGAGPIGLVVRKARSRNS